MANLPPAYVFFRPRLTWQFARRNLSRSGAVRDDKSWNDGMTNQRAGPRHLLVQPSCVLRPTLSPIAVQRTTEAVVRDSSRREDQQGTAPHTRVVRKQQYRFFCWCRRLLLCFKIHSRSGERERGIENSKGVLILRHSVTVQVVTEGHIRHAPWSTNTMLSRGRIGPPQTPPPAPERRAAGGEEGVVIINRAADISRVDVHHTTSVRSLNALNENIRSLLEVNFPAYGVARPSTLVSLSLHSNRVSSFEGLSSMTVSLVRPRRCCNHFHSPNEATNVKRLIDLRVCLRT